MTQIREFTEAEQQLVKRTLNERYGKEVPFEVGEAEIQLDPESDNLTECAVIYWQERGCHFVIFKMGEGRFSAQFFYSETTQFGTGKESFDNIGDCVVTVLQVQSDHERQMQGIRSGMTSLDFPEEYDGPLII